MPNLHIYRTPSGSRILFREAEVAGPPQYFQPRRRIELTTIYGSTYTVMSVAPESIIDGTEKEGEPGFHLFHWSPPS